jgi:UDP-N-acetylglucosamine 4,6-dehydratase
MFDNSKILITGATGSWGQCLVKTLLNQYDVDSIICFSRNELSQVKMRREISSTKLLWTIGDVRDCNAVEKAMCGVDYVFNLAALKHVPVCEENVQEAIKTNIDGALNIANSAIKCGVKKVINVSSDKAVEPINLYGMTKAVAEKIFLSSCNNTTRFVCIRGGNVTGSSGSVIPLFIDRIKSGQNIEITDTNMTRFFLSQQQAINLLLYAAINGYGGEIFVMNMPACHIVELADILMNRYGKTEVIVTGIRPGEKLDETLVAKSEAMNAFVYNEDYYLIIPTSSDIKIKEKYKHLSNFTHESFTSRSRPMNAEKIKTMLLESNFI